MTHTDDAIRLALLREHQHFCHDDFNANEMNDAQFRAFLAPLSRAELINEAGIDDTYTLDTFMMAWG